MKAAVLILLVAVNLAALYFGVSRFFVTFAEHAVVNGCVPVGCGHFHHQGMEDMRMFLGPSLKWLLGLVILNFCVAVAALIRCQRSKI
jgi:NO-binding membrane sensor protein with MHYT domain